MKGINASPKWRRLLIAVTLAAVVVLGLVVALAYAQLDFPSNNFPWVWLQTSGPDTHLAIGDWYTNNNMVNPPGAGPGDNAPHRFPLYVPCAIPDTTVLTLELFDPEIWSVPPVPLPPVRAIDEIRDAMHTIVTDNPALAPINADDATFTLIAPDTTTVVATTTYTPDVATDDQWVVFTTFTRGGFNCALGEASVVFTLEVSTSGNSANDDNAWRLRVTHPDNIPGTGDEPWPAIFQTSFQHADLPVPPVNPCPQDVPLPPFGERTPMDFHFFVNPGTPSIMLNNFDLDFPGFVPNATITYFLPDGTSVAGTPSNNAVWNNGDFVNRGGDVFNNPQPGWWRAQVCAAQENQYIFECPGFCVTDPPVPAPVLSQNCRSSGESQVIRYTIDFGNTSADAAAFEPDLTFTLPAGTTFESCSGLPCSESSPGVVTFSLPAVLPAGAAPQVTVDVRLDAGTPDPLNSTAQFDYADVFNNDYVPLTDTFQAQISECVAGGPPPGGNGERPPGIPEPATVTLFGLGLAGLAGYARARLRRRQET